MVVLSMRGLIAVGMENFMLAQMQLLKLLQQEQQQTQQTQQKLQIRIITAAVVVYVKTVVDKVHALAATCEAVDETRTETRAETSAAVATDGKMKNVGAEALVLW